MRIISGNLKGKTIQYISSRNTRPLKDSVRENIFNILNHSNLISTRVKGSNILDLYSGIGSFGLECISRDAKNVTFVEENYKAVEMLKKNLLNLSISKKAKVINDKIENIINQKFEKKFNILFFDPPFNDKKYLDNLRILKEKKIFKNEHLIIIHRERKTIDNFDDIFQLLLSREYGRSKILFGNFI